MDVISYISPEIVIVAICVEQAVLSGSISIDDLVIEELD